MLTYEKPVRQVRTLYNEGRHVEFQRAYGQLPQQLQRHPSLLVMRLVSAAKVDQAAYEKALREYVEFTGSSECATEKAFDYYLETEQYEKAMACLDDLDRAIGGDPYLSVVKGQALFLSGRRAEARQLLESVRQQDPGLVFVYRALLNVASVEPPFDEAIGYLSVLRNRFGFQIDETDPQFTQLLASAAYQRWKAGSR